MDSVIVVYDKNMEIEIILNDNRVNELKIDEYLDELEIKNKKKKGFYVYDIFKVQNL